MSPPGVTVDPELHPLSQVPEASEPFDSPESATGARSIRLERSNNQCNDTAGVPCLGLRDLPQGASTSSGRRATAVSTLSPKASVFPHQLSSREKKGGNMTTQEVSSPQTPPWPPCTPAAGTGIHAWPPPMSPRWRWTHTHRAGGIERWGKPIAAPFPSGAQWPPHHHRGCRTAEASPLPPAATGPWSQPGLLGEADVQGGSGGSQSEQLVLLRRRRERMGETLAGEARATTTCFLSPHLLPWQEAVLPTSCPTFWM